MSTVFSLLPLLLTVPFYAALIKIASRVYRKSQLSWKHAFAFAALGIAVGLAGALLNLAAGGAVPELLGPALGAGIQIALAGWFLGPRAVAASGAPVAFKGGASIAAIAVAIAFLAAVAVSLLVPHGQA